MPPPVVLLIVVVGVAGIAMMVTGEMHRVSDLLRFIAGWLG